MANAPMLYQINEPISIPDRYVRVEVYTILLIVVFRLLSAKCSVIIFLMRLFSSIYILYGGWLRMNIVHGAQLPLYDLTTDDVKQDLYLRSCMAVWVASVVLDVFKMKPLRATPNSRKPVKSNPYSSFATALFTLNALGLVCYMSAIEYSFIFKVNRDCVLKAFFGWSFGLKFIRVIVQGYSFLSSTQPGDYCELAKVIGCCQGSSTWIGLSNLINMSENFLSFLMFQPQSESGIIYIGMVVALAFDFFYRLWMCSWFFNIRHSCIMPSIAYNEIDCDDNRNRKSDTWELTETIAAARNQNAITNHATETTAPSLQIEQLTGATSTSSDQCVASPTEMMGCTMSYTIASEEIGSMLPCTTLCYDSVRSNPDSCVTRETTPKPFFASYPIKNNLYI